MERERTEERNEHKKMKSRIDGKKGAKRKKPPKSEKEKMLKTERKK